jgi:hypothetical protein
VTTRAAAATLGAIDDLGAFAGAYTLRRLAGPSEEPGVTEELVITEMAGADTARPLARMSPPELACEPCGRSIAGDSDLVSDMLVLVHARVTSACKLEMRGGERAATHVNNRYMRLQAYMPGARGGLNGSSRQTPAGTTKAYRPKAEMLRLKGFRCARGRWRVGDAGQ